MNPTKKLICLNGQKLHQHSLGWILSLAFLFSIFVACPASQAGDGSISRTISKSTSEGPGLVISLKISPPDKSLSSAVEENIPKGCKAVEISHGGTIDSVNNKIKWVFFDGTPRVLTYRLLGTDEISENLKLSGEGSFDGSSVTVSDAKNSDSK